MKKRIFTLLLTIAVCASVLVGCGSNTKESSTGSTPSPSTDTSIDPSNSFEWETRTIKIAHGTALDHPSHLAALEFEKMIEERTGGAVQVDVYGASSMGSEADIFSMVMQGGIDGTIMGGLGTLSEYEPVVEVEELPYMVETVEEAMALYQGPFGQRLAEIIGASTDTVLVDYFAIGGFRHVTNTVRPIVTPADMDGLKLRVGVSDIRVKLFEEFGASAIAMNFSELFTALQQKTVDGQENPLSVISANKFAEVQTYLSLTGHQFLNHPLMFSQKLWDEYQPELQDLILECGKEAGKWQRALILEQEETLLQELQDAGMIVNEVDKAAFQEKAGAIWVYFLEKHGDAGKELLDLAGIDYSAYM